MTFPLELYYFNQSLAFFEPAIERVAVKAYIETDINGNSEKRFHVEDVLSLSLHVRCQVDFLERNCPELFNLDAMASCQILTRF